MIWGETGYWLHPLPGDYLLSKEERRNLEYVCAGSSTQGDAKALIPSGKSAATHSRNFHQEQHISIEHGREGLMHEWDDDDELKDDTNKYQRTEANRQK